MGGVRGAMARRADEVYESLPAGQQEVARRVALELVRPGRGTEDTRRRAPFALLGESARPVVDRLARERLVVTDRDPATGEETVEVAHEALIRHWGRLRGWVQEDREFLVWKQKLALSREEWERSGHHVGLLLPGPKQVEADGWLAARPAQIDEAARRFIRLGQRRIQKRRAELEREFAYAIESPRDGLEALIAMVRQFEGVRPDAITEDILLAAASMFASEIHRFRPEEVLDAVEAVYAHFVGQRDVFGAIAYRLADIARHPELRARAVSLSEKVRQAFIESIRIPPPGDDEDARINPRVRLPGGCFHMGSPRVDRSSNQWTERLLRLVGIGGQKAKAHRREAPQHLVTVSPFKMQARVVTNGEYRRFDPEHDPDEPAFLPVVRVSWYEALAYSVWLGGSLPTEAQWEFAARGREGRTYPWGEQRLTTARANYRSGRLAPVGSYPLGATPEGIQDMAGNVWEWCFDRYGPYTWREMTDPIGPEHGSSRVLRGGSYSYPARGLRAAFRSCRLPEHQRDYVGFRVAWWPLEGQA
jgi:formylglycine-generating enzyme required for sulfatase activity